MQGPSHMETQKHCALLQDLVSRLADVGRNKFRTTSAKVIKSKEQADGVAERAAAPNAATGYSQPLGNMPFDNMSWASHLSVCY